MNEGLFPHGQIDIYLHMDNLEVFKNFLHKDVLYLGLDEPFYHINRILFIIPLIYSCFDLFVVAFG